MVRANQPIKKVWLPTEMKEALAEWAWRNRVKPGPTVVGIIEKIISDPKSFEGKAIPPAGGAYLSIYIAPELWRDGLETADNSGVTLSAMVRVGVADLLAESGIPWDVTTERPRNRTIPIRE